MRAPDIRRFLLRAEMLLSAALGLANPAAASLASVAPPTGERDLVVFVARERTELYRIVGSQALAYGTARFRRPVAIVADAAHQCFHVLEESARRDEPCRIWRIDGAGEPTMEFPADGATTPESLQHPVGLGLDADGRVLVTDAATGLWRLDEDGRLTQLLAGQTAPLIRITAACATADDGLLVGTSYLSEIVNLPIGDTAVPRLVSNQGGLYEVRGTGTTARVRTVLENRRPGGAEYETYWRTLSQVLVDNAGRIVLVDSGSATEAVETTYLGGRSSTHPQTRTLRSVIGGGVSVLHRDGRHEDLTFRTPAENSGPMRRPVGVAQWSDDTYLVADPEMYVEGIDGTGGLLLLHLDGTREARWPFGYQLKPVGVAILRGAGRPSAAVPELPVQSSELHGTVTAGPIVEIVRVALERRPADGGGWLGGTGLGWEAQSAEAAEQALRSHFEGAQWTVAEDGMVDFVARGVSPAAADTPWILRGKVTPIGTTAASIVLSYQRRSAFDAQLGSVDARVRRLAPEAIRMHVTVNIFTNDLRLKAEFDQVMPWKQRE